MARIMVTYRLPVINGFVRIPNASNAALTSVTQDGAIVAVPTASVEYDLVDENHIAFPAFERQSAPASDYYAILRSAI